MLPKNLVVPWFASRKDWRRVKAAASDSSVLGASYEHWLARLSELQADLTEKGHAVQRITIDPDEFFKFCPDAVLQPTLLRTYSFTYTTASITHRSLLASVTIADGSGKAMPPTTFEWELGEHGFEAVQTGVDDFFVDPTKRFGGFRVLDTNGDGLDDLLYLRPQQTPAPSWWGDNPEYTVRLSAGRGYGAPTRMLMPARVDYRNLYTPPLAMIYDASEPPGVVIWATKDVSKPDDPAWPGVQQIFNLPSFGNVPLFGSINFAVQQYYASVVPMDMDGDGLGDLAAGFFEVNNKGEIIPRWQFYRNIGGHRFAAPTAISFPQSTGALINVGYSMPMRGVDVDGDVRQELIVCRPSGAETLGTVLTNAGSYTTDLIKCNDNLFAQRSPVFFDANGDGLDDVVFPTDPTTANPPVIGMTTVLNVGRGVPSVRGRLDNHELTGGVRVLDYDGDGQADVLGTRALEWDFDFKKAFDKKEIRVYRSTASQAGIALARVPEVAIPFAGQTNEDFELLEVGDVNGDGLQDLVGIQNGHIVQYLRKGKRPDVLLRVVNGVGAEARFKYTTLADPLTYTAEFFNPREFPQRAVSGGLLVVSQHQVSSGAAPSGTRRFEHYYANAVEDIRGRGFLGFEKHDVLEPLHATRLESVYSFQTTSPGSSTYPFLGLPIRETTRVENIDGVIHERVVTRKLDSHFNAAVGTYAPAASRITVEEYGLVNGQQVLTYRQSTDQQVDGFGNVVASATTLGNGDQYSQSQTYSVLEANWLIDRLTRSVEVSVVNGKSAQRTTAYRYDAFGSLELVVVEPGDDSGPDIKALTQPQADGMSSLFSRYSRNSQGQITSVSHDVDLAFTARERFVSIAYESADQMFPTRITNKLGHSSQVAFHSGLGVRAAAVDTNGVYSRWRYDTFGRLKRSELGGGESSSLTYRGYPGLGVDPARQSLEITTAGDAGASSRTRFDILGRTVQQTSYSRMDGKGVDVDVVYDPWGRRVATSHPHFEGTPIAARDTFEYDDAGRIVRGQAADGTIAAYSYAGLLIDEFDADPADPTAIKRTETRDLAGRLVSSVQHARAFAGRSARDLEVRYQYGPFATLERVTNLGIVTTSASFDRRGRRLDVADASRGRHVYSYNNFGEITDETVAQMGSTPEVRQYQYDDLGRFRALTTRDGLTTYQWDTATKGIGQLAAVASAQGVVTRFTYDVSGRVSHKIWQIGMDQFDVGTDYDQFGRVSRLAYPDQSGLGFAVQYQYGPHGVLKSVANDATLAPYWTVLETDQAGSARNPSGAFPRMQFGNGVVTQFTENAARPGQLGAIQTDRGPANIQALAYEFDSKRNLRARNDGLAATSEIFDYDELNRLHRWTVSGQSATRYDYDDLGNLTARTQETGPGQNFSYQYAQTNGAGPYAVTTSNGLPLSYDQEGNQLTAPGRTATFTTFGLPLHIDGRQQSFDFLYDGFGTRVSKRTNNNLEIVSIPGLYQRQSKAKLAQLFTVRGPLGPVCQIIRESKSADITLYIHRDNLGSTETVTDEVGAVYETRNYDPLGNLVDIQPAPKKKKKDKKKLKAGIPTVSLGFVGQESDDELGLINMVGRMYDPSLGQFISPDPMVESALSANGLNRYAYVLNNPATLVDPTGQWSEGPGGSDWGLPPIDPLPGGPIGVGVGGNPSPGPTGGSSPSPPPRPRYNPVNEAENRVRAAKIEYEVQRAARINRLNNHATIEVEDYSHYEMDCSAAGLAGCIRVDGYYRWHRNGMFENAVEGTAKFVNVLLTTVNLAQAVAWLGTRGVTALLAEHLETAVARFEAEGFTAKQAARIAENPELEAAFRGDRIDAFFKDAVRADPQLGHLNVTPRFTFGPDVVSPGGGVWWDVTTFGQWGKHVQMYTPKFGQGVPLLYEFPPAPLR